MEVFLASHESILALLYMLGIAVWMGLWYVADGYRLMMGPIRLLWLPFVLCLAVLLANVLLWVDKAGVAPVELEETLFNFLDNRSNNIIGATGSILVIATIIYGVQRSQMPKDFIRFEALAFICFIGFSTPIIWIPTDQPHLLMLLRHYQTVPFTYGIYFCVSGILVLLHGLGIEIPPHGQTE